MTQEHNNRMAPHFSREIRDDGLEDPMVFVYDYSQRNGLPEQCGLSVIERDCAIRAEQAREEYKARRHAADIEAGYTPVNYKGGVTSPISKPRHSGSPDGYRTAEERKFSASQKYNIRLRNNRKSAHASKVHTEILKRLLSKALQDVSNSLCRKCGEPIDTDERNSSASNSKDDNLQSTVVESQGLIETDKVTGQQKSAKAEKKTRSDRLTNRLERASTALLNSNMAGIPPQAVNPKASEQVDLSKGMSSGGPGTTTAHGTGYSFRADGFHQGVLETRMPPLYSTSPVTAVTSAAAVTSAGLETVHSPWKQSVPRIQISDIPMSGPSMGSSLQPRIGGSHYLPQEIPLVTPMHFSSSPIQTAMGRKSNKIDVHNTPIRPFIGGTFTGCEGSSDDGPVFPQVTGPAHVKDRNNELGGVCANSSAVGGGRNEQLG